MLSPIGTNHGTRGNVGRESFGKEIKRCESSLHFVDVLHFCLEMGGGRGVVILGADGFQICKKIFQILKISTGHTS